MNRSHTIIILKEIVGELLAPWTVGVLHPVANEKSPLDSFCIHCESQIHMEARCSGRKRMPNGMAQKFKHIITSFMWKRKIQVKYFRHGHH
jgi:hypothetical protein